jgi:opacity protein-like surface antigen
MRLLRNPVRNALVVAAMAVALAPQAVFADHEPAVIQGNFTVAFVIPSAVNFCPSGATPIEFQGLGNISKLGSLFLTVKKCATPVDGVLTFAGTFTMTAGNGDILRGTYAGKKVGVSNENGYGQFVGSFAMTGGTGRFRHASGVLSFTATTGPFGVGVAGPATGAAFYLVQGTMWSPDED